MSATALAVSRGRWLTLEIGERELPLTADDVQRLAEALRRANPPGAAVAAALEAALGGDGVARDLGADEVAGLRTAVAECVATLPESEWPSHLLELEYELDVAAPPLRAASGRLAVAVDLWRKPNERRVVAAEPAAVEAAIRGLEGEWSADLFILRAGAETSDRDPWLAVTSSLGRYAVGAATRFEVFHHLVGDPALDGEVEFAFGGQTTTNALRNCVDADLAVAAARHWLETEALSPELHWERQ